MMLNDRGSSRHSRAPRRRERLVGSRDQLAFRTCRGHRDTLGATLDLPAQAGPSTAMRIGSQGRSVRAWRLWFPVPLSIPCVRFSRTRLTDDLPGMAYAALG